MVIDSNDVQGRDSPVTGLTDNGDGKWWVSSNGHRFVGEVLQLRIRCEIMKFIGLGVKTREEIALAFGMKEHISELHLSLMEKAEMIEQTDLGYRSITIGTAYLKNFEAFAESSKIS